MANQRENIFIALIRKAPKSFDVEFCGVGGGRL